jgi:hypothetical protein
MPVSIYWLIAPLSLIIAALALTNHYRPITIDKWDVAVVFLWLVSAAIYWWIEILIKMILWQGYMTSPDDLSPQDKSPRKEQAYRNEPRPIPNLNGYNQTTLRLKINAEQKFAKSLIDMRNGNLKIDLTEAYWIEGINGNRYGEERDKFADMKKRWAKWEIIERAGNGYQVADWRKVRMVAQGHPPPHS